MVVPFDIGACPCFWWSWQSHTSGSNKDSTDSGIKDKVKKEDSKKRLSTCNDVENGCSSENQLRHEKLRKRSKISLLITIVSIVFFIGFLVEINLWGWYIFGSYRDRHFHNHSHLHNHLASDSDSDLRKLYLDSKLKELGSCPVELENHVPCFTDSKNISLGSSDRRCLLGWKQNCLVLPPSKYKIPLKWPTGKDCIWVANVKISAHEVLSSERLTKRMIMLEEEQISFKPVSVMFDGVEDYARQIANMMGLKNESGFTHAGVRAVLDIGCGFGSFGAHLFSKGLMTMCIANYEASGSQVQITLERGLPAMIASFTSKQLPYPSLSFDMLHCARCGMEWGDKDGKFLIEADRVLRPGGYFVWTSLLIKAEQSLVRGTKHRQWKFIQNFAKNLCWNMLSLQDETVVWKKTRDKNCYASRESGDFPSICGEDQDIEHPYYGPLKSCIGGTHNNRWIPIDQKTTWPSKAHLNSSELAVHGVYQPAFSEDAANWKSGVENYWSLLSPMIFSDHPKRLGDDILSPPFNMFRNVLDMNAHFGGFNSALMEAGKPVWVMNVVPVNGLNYLPLIHDRGFVGAVHDWCEPFPTYPRTYDLVHAEGLLTLEAGQHKRCTMLGLLTEIDRLLRPEGWVIIRDAAPMIESARHITRRLKWGARLVKIEGNIDEMLLICQKPFLKRPSNQ